MRRLARVARPSLAPAYQRGSRAPACPLFFFLGSRRLPPLINFARSALACQSALFGNAELARKMLRRSRLAEGTKRSKRRRFRASGISPLMPLRRKPIQGWRPQRRCSCRCWGRCAGCAMEPEESHNAHPRAQRGRSPARLPTSWMMATKAGDEFTSRMFEAINGMLLDVLAAVARKDYVDRRRPAGPGAGEGEG